MVDSCWEYFKCPNEDCPVRTDKSEKKCYEIEGRMCGNLFKKVVGVVSLEELCKVCIYHKMLKECARCKK